VAEPADNAAKNNTTMRSFYAPSKPMPLDQADGLRRMFAGRHCHVLALVANPHVPFGGLVLDRLASAMAALGRQVLVVDAASTSPPPHELAAVDLSACIEAVAPGVRYLPAKGLPLNYVDTRGFGGAFVDAVQSAAQQSGQAADVVLLHADAADLARLFKQNTARHQDLAAMNPAMHPAMHPPVRPMLLGADHPESIKHAYANAKLLAQRCGLVQHDLILVSAPHSPRVNSISHSLADCVERFLDGSIGHIALIDPAVTVVSARAAQLQRQTADADLQRLVRAQLQDDDHHEAQAISRPPSHAAVRAAARLQFGTQPSRDARQPSHSISSTAF
jgi:hypothetical protein